MTLRIRKPGAGSQKPEARNCPVKAAVRSSPLLASGFWLLASLLGCTPQPPFKPVAEVHDIMEGIVAPTSDVVFNAAVWENGQPVGTPKNDEEWEQVHTSALALAESGNLLMFRSRAKDQGDWIKFSTDLIDAAVVASKAAEAQDLEALLDAGGHVWNACSDCHKQYVPREGETQ